MSDELNEELDSQDQPTEEVVNTEEVEETVPDTEPEDLETLQEKNKRLFERAKKAEAEAKLLKAERLKAEEKAKVPPAKVDTDMSFKDQYALMQAQVPIQDVDEVIKAAKLLGKSIPEALQDDLVKTRLSVLAEQRRTAEVSNTGGSKRITAKVSDETLVNKALRGDLPDDPEALVEARFNLKKKK